MNKDEKRALGSAALHRKELRRKRQMDNKAYQTMNGLTRYMDRYYLDALIGIIPGITPARNDANKCIEIVPIHVARQTVHRLIGLVPSPMLSTSWSLPSPTATCAVIHASRRCSFASYNYIIRIAR